MKRLAPTALVLACITGAAHAVAQTPDGDARMRQARELFEAGVHLREKGDCDGATERFLESLRLNDQSAGAHLNVAECLERSDPTNAWRHFKDAELIAAKAGDDRAQLARNHLQALAPRVALMRIEVVGARDDEVTVEVDGKSVPLAYRHDAFAVEPGNHTLSVSASGRKPWSGRGEASVGRTASYRVQLDLVPQAPPVAATKETSGDIPGRTQRIVGIAVAGVGLVGVGIGSYFGLAAKKDHDDLTVDCKGPYPHCDPKIPLDVQSQLRSRNSSAQSKATVSTVAFIVGGAALAGGAGLFLLAPTGSSTTGWQVVPSIAKNGSSIDVLATW